MMKHNDALKLSKNARGQLEATIKMMEEGRYCIDISNQLLATIAMLKKANTMVLHNHLEGCVKEAINNQDDFEEKLAEIEEIMAKLAK